MASPILNLVESMKDVKRLMEIHADVGGTAQGRRYGLEVLNKGGVIFLAAAWEAFIEDLAIQAIDHILTKAKSHTDTPLPIRKAAAKALEEDKNELKVWDLAGDGWKTVVRNYRDQVIKEEIATFNTPKPHNVDALLKKLLAIDKISSNWSWPGMAASSSYAKLKAFVEMRGAIAHRGQLPASITKSYVRDHRKFINKIAVRTSNVVRTEVKKVAGSFPWPASRFGNFR